MFDTQAMRKALSEVRAIEGQVPQNAVLKSIVESKEEVLLHYGPVFRPENIGSLERETFLEFLTFRGNRHWSGLQRMQKFLCKDMDRLRKGLATLLDETRPLKDRLDELLPSNKPPYVKGLGKAILTAILLVAYPDKYGVFNGTSQGAMQRLQIWPDFERGASFSSKYMVLNPMMQRIARELNVDLWTLDALWWGVLLPSIRDEHDVGDRISPASDQGQAFGMEAHLHEFLRDNWDNIALGKEWQLYEEDGDLAGFEYSCEIGYIDLLAKRRSGNGWLVIELKRAQTSDATVGQILRYMGWVKERMAGPGEKVEGLIIAHEFDKKLHYALKSTQDIQLMRYEVHFKLSPVGS
ncbi:MAG TPA: endonuclease NucS domain-containing protein [bacterium]|nr:endonuclease NucS domain-containing protein [bacterium]